MLRLGRKGFGRRVELIIITVIAAALFFFITGAFYDQRRLSQSENESCAIETLKAINAAMGEWRISQTPPSYSEASLPALAQVYPSYVDSGLGKGTKDGYTFTLFPMSRNKYLCVATPLSHGASGTRIFRITESGAIEVSGAEDWYLLK